MSNFKEYEAFVIIDLSKIEHCTVIKEEFFTGAIIYTVKLDNSNETKMFLYVYPDKESAMKAIRYVSK